MMCVGSSSPTAGVVDPLQFQVYSRAQPEAGVRLPRCLISQEVKAAIRRRHCSNQVALQSAFPDALEPVHMEGFCGPRFEADSSDELV